MVLMALSLIKVQTVENDSGTYTPRGGNDLLGIGVAH